MYIPDYYLPAFAYLHATHAVLIDAFLIRQPEELVSAYFRARTKPEASYRGEEAYELLLGLSQHLEAHLRREIEKHTVYFWLHLYRRIAPKLSPMHSGKVDANTVALVRLVAESAFKKYGTLRATGDVSPIGNLSNAAVMGGWLQKAWLTTGTKAEFTEYMAGFRTKNEWVLRDFSPRIYAGAYRVEGLAYQYWRTTAYMRAIGKGASLWVDAKGKSGNEYDDDLDRLIISYDLRIVEKDDFTSNLGSVVNSTSRVSEDVGTIVLPHYNAGGMQIPSSANIVDPFSGRPFTPNFLAIPFYLKGYLDAHLYAAPSFRQLHGFGLAEFCAVVGAICLRLSAQRAWTDLRNGLDPFVAFIWLMKRAYVSPHLTLPQVEVVVREVAEMVGERFGAANVSNELPLVIEFLTLRAETQSKMSLWSFGPQAFLVPYGDEIVVDFFALTEILRNLFFGLREYDPLSQKGHEFEKFVKDKCVAAGLAVCASGQKLCNLNGQVREIDVGIRCGNVLIAAECRVPERPLDFEIGRLRTLRRREEILSEKLNQVQTLAEFIRQSPRGANYDFAWAHKVIPIVVSPYVEWLWNSTEQLWVDFARRLPRVMTPAELVDLAKGINAEDLVTSRR